jgi:hypothetical protein
VIVRIEIFYGTAIVTFSGAAVTGLRAAFTPSVEANRSFLEENLQRRELLFHGKSLRGAFRIALVEIHL